MAGMGKPGPWPRDESEARRVEPTLKPDYIDRAALERHEKTLASIKESRAFTLASNDAKLLFILHQQLVETLLYGSIKSPLPGSHHT